MRFNWIIIPLVIAATAYMGAHWSRLGLKDWYQHLRKPHNTPNGELIGSIWTFLYILIGVSVLWFWNIPAFSWFHYVVGAVLLYNAYLNATWNRVFFVEHNLKKAHRHIRLLDLVTIIAILMMLPISPIAAFLLLPYLIWIIIATNLAKRIMEMNK